MKDLPDLSISPLMWIQIPNEGLGAVHAGTVVAIIPDTTAPKTRSLLISSAFPDGLTICGPSEENVMNLWFEIGDTPDLQDQEIDVEEWVEEMQEEEEEEG